MKKIVQILFSFILGLGLVSCEVNSIQAAPSPPPANESSPIFTPAPAQMVFPTATIQPIPLGPNSYPSGINPLTGLAAKEPANLGLPPVLASIANFPPTARPQAGLSYSPIVFELFIGDGMTRNLAVFYGDYPEQLPEN